MRKRIIIILLFVSAGCISSQTIGKYGIKAGLIFSGLTPGDKSTVIAEDSSAILNFLSYDVGVFAEILSSKKFSLSLELHYNIKGERNPNFIKFVTREPGPQGNIYDVKYLSDRLHYFSLQALPKYHIVLSRDESLYLTGGPSLDYLIGNSNSENDNALKVNSGLEIAVIAGFGALINDWILLDFRFQHNFTPAYNLSYGSEKISRLNNSAIFLLGIVL